MKRAWVAAVAMTIIVMLQSSASAQDAQDPKKWADNLYETLLTDGDDAFADILRGTFAGKFTPPQIDNARYLMLQMRQIGGALTGYELVSQTQLGPRLRRFTYVTYYLNAFLVHQLTFYKGNRGWVLTGFDFTTKPNEIPWQ